MQIGDTQHWERRFTEEDVRLFGKVSKDMGAHHIFPDEQGRVMVHDLLIATLPTKIGGDINFLAHNLSYEFIRPVFVGDTVHCLVTVTQVEKTDEQLNVSAAIICHNQDGDIVLRGHTSGMIRKPRPMCVGLN